MNVSEKCHAYGCRSFLSYSITILVIFEFGGKCHAYSCKYSSSSIIVLVIHEY